MYKLKVIIPIIRILPLIIVLGVITWRKKKYREYHKMNAITYAKVTKVEMDKEKDKNEYKIEYEFTTDGKTYYGCDNSYGVKIVGQRLKVHYNADEPERSQLAEKFIYDNISIIPIALVFLLISYIIITILIK